MAGKDKIERGFRLTWDDSAGTPQDLSHDVIPGSAGNVGGFTAEEIDMTGITQAIRNYQVGFSQSEVTARLHMDDTATTGAHTVTKDTIGDSGTLLLEFGSAGAAPTTGDPTWSGEYVLVNAQPTQDAGRFVIDCRWLPSSTAAADPLWDTKA